MRTVYVVVEDYSAGCLFAPILLILMIWVLIKNPIYICLLGTPVISLIVITWVVRNVLHPLLPGWAKLVVGLLAVAFYCVSMFYFYALIEPGYTSRPYNNTAQNTFDRTEEIVSIEAWSTRYMNNRGGNPTINTKLEECEETSTTNTCRKMVGYSVYNHSNNEVEFLSPPGGYWKISNSGILSVGRIKKFVLREGEEVEIYQWANEVSCIEVSSNELEETMEVCPLEYLSP